MAAAFRTVLAEDLNAAFDDAYRHLTFAYKFTAVGSTDNTKLEVRAISQEEAWIR